VQDDRTERLAKAKQSQPRGRPRARLCDLNEIAAYLHVSRRTIYRLLDRGLPCLRVGYVLRFDLAVVLAWIQDFTDRGDQLHWSEDHASIKKRIRRVH
jgi:excisionase family DNA binding protein